MSAQARPLPVKRLDWWAVTGLAIAWSLLLGGLAVLRYLAFKTGFDLAVYSHVIWTTTQGRPFANSLVEATINFLGHHFVPLVVLLAPLYAAWPDPRILLAAQSVILAAGALPLYGFARRRVGAALACTVVLAFLLSPALQNVALFDFHEIALTVPLLMLAGAALLDERPRAVVICLVLAMLVKEEVILITAGFGLYAALIQRRWRFGLALLTGTVLWGFVLFRWVLPALSGGSPGVGFLWRYGALGGSPGEVLRTLATRPGTLVGLVATADKATFLWQLFAPLAGLPLLGLPAFFLALPPLATSLLSDYAYQFSIRYHYTAPLLPLLFLSTVVALQRLQKWGARAGLLAGAVLVAASLLGAWRLSPLPGGLAYRPSQYKITDEARAIREMLRSIPAAVSVAADSHVQPWLANRWQIASLDTLPFQQFPGEVVPERLVVQDPGPYGVGPPLYPWLVADPGSGVLRVPRYSVAASTPGGMQLWARRPAAEDILLARYNVAFERGLWLVGAGAPSESAAWGTIIRAAPGTTLPVWMAWRSDALLEQRITFSLHLVDQEGRLVVQADSEMGGGRFPTTLWHTWVDRPTVAGEFQLSLPADLPAGSYRLLAGAFETDTVAPLAGLDGGQWAELATLEVRQ